jgi:hypothetical protein
MLTLLLLISTAWAIDPIETNEVKVVNPPKWLTSAKVDKVVQRVQGILEWDIRKIQVYWHPDRTEFERSHGYGSAVLAYSRKQDKTVHMGPKIAKENFEAIFGHELTHVILFQKYGDAIPKWLEEGLANYVGKQGKVDYGWLAAQAPRDVTTLSHPFKGISSEGSYDHARFHYMASTALIEMIAAKCDLEDLLQLSVGKKLENFLSTYCGISDVNQAYSSWIKKKNPSKKSAI